MRPVPPPPGSPRHHSLADLLALDVQRGAYGTGRSAWLARALSSPLWHLGPAELRLLLDHGYTHDEVLRLVAERLDADPLAVVDGEAGALVAAAIRVMPETWTTAGIPPALLSDVSARALAALARWDAAPAWLVEDLEVAVTLFGDADGRDETRRGTPEY
jgi:hypothetical protein